MRIAYIVLSCKNYENTRIVWQRNTSLRDVPESDIYYLSYRMELSKRLFSWGAHDAYYGLPFKLIDFFRYLYLDQYDWFVIIDDDTYIYVKRLEELLKQYSSAEPIVIGKLLTHLRYTEWGDYFSGGAGTVISRATYDILYKHVLYTRHDSYLARHWCADICLGTWLHQYPFITCINSDKFNTDMEGDSTTAISFHHLKIESDWNKFYNYE
jgi:hypothetical protein